MRIRLRFLAAWMILIAVALTERPAQGQDGGLKAGDRLITTERLDVQAGSSTAATLEAGTTVTVVDVKQGWVGIVAQQNGQKIVGWVKPNGLRRAAGAAADAPKTAEAGKAEPDSEAFREGYAAHVRGQLSAAITGYDEAIRQNPNHARAYNNRGLVYQAKGDVNRAIADFSEAVRLGPTVMAAYLNRGAAYAKKGDADKAIEDYNEAIRLDPHAVQAYKLRAAAYQAKGEISKAEADMVQAGKMYRPKYDTIGHKAVKIELEVKGKDFIPSYEVLDGLIDEAKANVKVKNTYTEDDAMQALKTIDALLLRKKFITIDQALLCDALVARRLTPKLVASIDPKQLRFRPKPGDLAHFSYSFPNALIYASIGEAMGLPIYAVLAPGHAFVRWQLEDASYVNWETTAGTVTTNSEYQAWRHISDSAIKNGIYATVLTPNEVLASVYYHVGLVWSGAWQGLQNDFRDKDEATRARKAIDCFTRAIELNRKLYDAYFQRGRCWTTLKEIDKSLADNGVAIRLDPEQPSAYFGRGMGYLTRGNDKKSVDDIKKAIDDFDKVVDLSPQAPAGYYFRGVARMQSKELDKSMEDLNKCLELEPRFVDAYRARAKLWESLGNGERAKADVIKVKSLEQQMQRH